MEIYNIYELVDYLEYLFKKMGIEIDIQTPINKRGLEDILMIYNNKEFILNDDGNIFAKTIDK